MTLIDIQNGTRPDADEVMNDLSFALTASLNYALDGATTTNQDNLKIDFFDTDTASSTTNFKYYLGKYYLFSDSETNYEVIVTASSTTASSSGDVTLTDNGDGTWTVTATGTFEEQRAKIITYLFYNSSGGASSRIVNNFTSVTAIQTNDPRDVGRRVHYGKTNAGSNTSTTNTGTFDSSTGNVVSAWSVITSAACTSSTGWYMPASTALHTASSTSSELETDTSGDDQLNPEDCKVLSNNGVGESSTVEVIIACKSDITWSGTGSDYDFSTDGSIPDFTMIDAGTLSGELVTDATTITTSETAAIVKAIYGITSGNTFSIECSFDGGSNYSSLTHKEIGEISNTGTSMKIKFTLSATSTDGSDYIDAYASYYG